MTDSGEPDRAKNADAAPHAGIRSGGGHGPPSVLAHLEERAKAVPRLRLRDETEAPTANDAKADSSDRYQLLGEIARGGVGIILQGRDVDLGRDVAIKVIRPEHAESPEILRRFIEEAQIGGQLQHPGIVPVYEIGLRDERRVFFAMKLIRGRTLESLLDERKDTAVNLPRFLSIFEQVCQTVAYAHARGVVHRDLKPANVLVGAFGEVQVVDWGFAKVLGRAEEPAAAESPVHTVRSGSTESASQVGAVLGTPRFMPPEQALGHVDLVDERADVFALGATLCQILTGKPPYTKPGYDVLVQAAQADLADAHERLDACAADAELVKLCRWCLAPEREKRPASAQVVAGSVSAYLETVQERARAAEVDAARAQVRARAERKARKLTLGLAAAVVVALVTGGGAYLWTEHQWRARASEAARVVADQSVEVVRLRTDGRWDEAIQAAERALDLARSGDADPEIVQRALLLLDDTTAGAARAERNATLLAELESIRAGRGDKVDFPAVDRAYARAFARFGIGAETAEPDAAERIAATGIGAEIAGFLDEWIWLRGTVRLPRDHLLAVAREVDPDGWRNRLRDASLREDRDALTALSVNPDLEGNSPNLLARHLSAVGERDSAITLLRQAQRLRPDDFWINFELGFELTLLVPPSWQEAISFYRVALGKRPKSVQLRHELGIALFKIGDYDQAIEAWTDALALQPDDLHAYDHIIEAHEKKGIAAELRDRWREKAERAPDDAVAQYKYGRVSEVFSDWDEVIAAYQRVLALEPGSALFHRRLGEAYELRGDLENALVAHRGALELDPSHARARAGIARCLHQQGRIEEAIAGVREAIELNPYDPLLYNILGVICTLADRPAEAEDAYREAFRMTGSFGHLQLGQVYLDRGELDAAIELLRIATAMPERNSENRFVMSAEIMPDPKTGGTKVRPVLVPAHPKSSAFLALGNAYQSRGQWGAARQAFEDALRRESGFTWIQEFLLGHMLRILGEREAAAVHFRNSIQALRTKLGQEGLTRHPGYADVLYYLGFVELANGNIERGEACLREFAALPVMMRAPEERRAHFDAELARAIDLARELPSILAGDKEWSSPHEQALGGWLLEEMGYLREAAQLLEAAFDADPALAGEPVPYYQVWHYATYLVIPALAIGYGELGSDDGERQHWRRKALEWMRADLDLWQLRGDDPRMLRQWLRNSVYGLARCASNLERMPTEERRAWEDIWDEVRARLGG